MGANKVNSEFLAQHWHMSVADIENLMTHCGIVLESPKQPLSQEDLVKLRHGIEKLQQDQQKKKKNEPIFAVQQPNAYMAKKKVQDKEVEENTDLQKIQEYVKHQYIFIDTCSLFHPQCMVFLQRLIPFLLEEKKCLYIPSRVVHELEKVSEAKPEYKPRCRELKKLFNIMYEQAILSLRGEESDNFADNVFLTQFTRYRMRYPLLLITQDRNLASDILNLNRIKSQRGYPVSVQRISNKGYLEKVPPAPDY